MIVPREIKKLWKREVEFGDIERISENTGISTVTVGTAIRKGRCSQLTFDKINAYLIKKKSERKEAVNVIVKQLTDND